MKNNKKLSILVLISLLSLSNCAIAEVNTDNTVENSAVEKVKINKNTLISAQNAINEKNYNTAIDLLTGYINEKPKKYEAYKLRGDAYYALRRYDLAQKDYQTAIDLKSSDDKFVTNTKYVSAIVLGADKNEQLQNTELGDLYGALMYAQKAQNDSAYTTSYENALKYNSHIYLPQPNKGEINRINCPQKYGKIVNPQGIDINIYGSIDDIEKGNYSEALYKLQSVTAQYPNYYLGHYLTGVVLTELEKEDDAIKSFEKAISLNPYDFESYASLGRIYYSKAEMTFSNSDAQKSIDYFNKALALNKNCPTYYFYIGMNELQTGNTNVAIENFDKALKINPSDYNSMYYKLIAQYINGNYQDVADGATKLIYKHVSNYNSVLYLRALAYTKLNDTERALQDLNTLENNIEDIYNTDLKQVTAREKSLESYVSYLKSEIQHLKGAGAASDYSAANANPIINRLINAKKAIEPYEKSLQGDTISLNDYKKFESFYSTSLPKLLESGAIITYEDIDNQYDYIRTTFADLGISFLYTDPNYKITTIKDYPYKKYYSKLSQQNNIQTETHSASDERNVELAKSQTEKMRQTTPQTELLIQEGQKSVAQMLALNELSGKTNNSKPQSADQLKTITADAEPQYKPQTPDAENINTSKNIASGEIYESPAPSVNTENNEKVKNILNEEKKYDENVPVLRLPQEQTEIKTTSDANVEIALKTPSEQKNIVSEKTVQKEPKEITKSEPETMKFSADEIKQTDDIVIKYAQKPTTEIVSATQENEAAANNIVSDTRNEIKEQEKALKQAQIEEQKRLKAEEKAAKQSAIQAQKELKAQQKALKQAKTDIKENASQAPKVIKSVSKDVQNNAGNIVSETISSVSEKHADINSSDYGVQNPINPPEVDNIEDIVILEADTSSKKLTSDSDLFTKDTVFTNPQPQISQVEENVHTSDTSANEKEKEPEPEVITENTPEEIISKQEPVGNVSVVENELPHQDSVEVSDTQNDVQQENSVQVKLEENTPEEKIVEVPAVNVQQITVPETIVEETQLDNASQVSENEEYIPYSELNPADKTYVKNHLSRVLNEMLPANSDNISDSNEQALEKTLKETKSIKEQRIQLKNSEKLAKKQQKAQKAKAKETARLEKQKIESEMSKEKLNLAQKEAEEKMKLKEIDTKAKQTERLQKQLTNEQIKLVKNQAEDIQKTEARLESMAEKVAQEQQKVVEATDEVKIQRLKARLAGQNNQVLSSEEQAVIKAKNKAEKDAAKEAYKARQAQKKADLKIQKELEKAEQIVNNDVNIDENTNSFKRFISKIQFWKKN